MGKSIFFVRPYLAHHSSLPQKGLTVRNVLIKLLGIPDLESLRAERRTWVEKALETSSLKKDEKWTGSVAVGSQDFTERVRATLEVDPKGPSIVQNDDGCVLREEETAYNVVFEG